MLCQNNSFTKNLGYFHTFHKLPITLSFWPDVLHSFWTEFSLKLKGSRLLKMQEPSR